MKMKNPNSTAPQSVRDYLRKIGMKGGRSKSDAKLHAIGRNLKKAIAARIKGGKE
jgi:hypothetical protein